MSILQLLASLLNVGVCVTGLLRSRSFFVIYWIIALFIVAPMLPQYASKMYDPNVIAFANCYSMLFNVLFLATQLTFFSDERINDPELSREVLQKLARVCVVLAVGSLVTFFLAVPPAATFSSLNWAELAAQRSGFRLILINVSQFSLLLAAGVIVPVLRARRHRTELVLVVLICLLAAVLHRVKAYILIVTFPFLVHFVWIRRGTLTFRFTARVSGFSVAVILLYFLVSYARWAGTFQSLISSPPKAQTLVAVVRGSVESDLWRTYYQIVGHFSHHQSLGGASYTRVLTVPIGRLVGEPPEPNPMYLYYELTEPYRQSALRGSNHPTIYGDAYANFGVFGMFLAPFLAGALGALRMTTNSAGGFLPWMTIGVVSFGLPLMLRGSVYYGLYGIIMGMLGAVVLNALVVSVPETFRRSE